MTEEKLNQEELLTVEDSFLRGLLDAYEDNQDDVRTIQIARNGRTLFEFDVRGLSEKEYNDLQDQATKFKKAKNLGGVKVPEETNVPRFRSSLIYHATVKEHRDKLWNNKQAWKQTNVLNGIDLIDKILKAGEKSAVIEIIDDLSGFGSEGNELLKNSSGQEDE
ncbi:hypothetical protein NCCP2222_01830 [Sporosarcina sp. NCCP-2222]|uniref:phage tail assembly chaperone n=1 Tax=Sporosarcina sp. NCCP-2222 TaxID=2935073 RepID=UPI00208A7EDD|nr:hypothetical protein [Sporosarcina sp. NCCP-2222]GKV54236.1 hypothetical protein NCCP2222_01830 [Sporosarcina sp. NCCP-2222]